MPAPRNRCFTQTSEGLCPGPPNQGPTLGCPSPLASEHRITQKPRLSHLNATFLGRIPLLGTANQMWFLPTCGSLSHVSTPCNERTFSNRAGEARDSFARRHSLRLRMLKGSWCGMSSSISTLAFVAKDLGTRTQCLMAWRRHGISPPRLRARMGCSTSQGMALSAALLEDSHMTYARSGVGDISSALSMPG